MKTINKKGKYLDRTCPKCGHVWTPRVPSPKTCPRCGLCMPEWREKQKKRLQDYYKLHKPLLRQNQTDYRRKNIKQIRIVNNKTYKKERKLWTNGIHITPEIWRKAESLAEEILTLEGFEEIFYLRERSFPFDYLAKKKGLVYAIDVTTSQRKPIRPLPAELCIYLNLKLLLLFIKPDFTAYRLVSISSSYLKRTIYKSFNIHNLNGFKKLEEIYAK